MNDAGRFRATNNACWITQEIAIKKRDEVIHATSRQQSVRSLNKFKQITLNGLVGLKALTAFRPMYSDHGIQPDANTNDPNPWHPLVF